jgi:hypothetical protein
MLPQLREITLPNKIAFASLFPKCNSKLSAPGQYLSGRTWGRITFTGALYALGMIRRIDFLYQQLEGKKQWTSSWTTAIVLTANEANDQNRVPVTEKITNRRARSFDAIFDCAAVNEIELFGRISA